MVDDINSKEMRKVGIIHLPLSAENLPNKVLPFVYMYLVDAYDFEKLFYYGSSLHPGTAYCRLELLESGTLMVDTML